MAFTPFILTPPQNVAGGFDGTSNVLAGKMFNIPVKGTHAHAYITSFSGIAELKTRTIAHKLTGAVSDLLELAIGHRAALAEILDVSTDESSEGELAAMVSFAIAFPNGFMALVDTYDVKRYFFGRLHCTKHIHTLTTRPTHTHTLARTHSR